MAPGLTISPHMVFLAGFLLCSITVGFFLLGRKSKQSRPHDDDYDYDQNSQDHIDGANDDDISSQSSFVSEESGTAESRKWGQALSGFSSWRTKSYT